MLSRTQPESIKCIERVFLPNLNRVLSTDGEYNNTLRDLLDKLSIPHENEENHGYAEVTHEWRKTNAPYGRYFSSGSLIRCRRRERAFITNNLYVELDIRASNPTILYNLINRNFGINLPTLEAYVRNRDASDQAIFDSVPPHVWEMEINDGLNTEKISVKKFVNSALNGSNLIWNIIEPHLPVDAFARLLRQDFQYSLSLIGNQCKNVPCSENCHNPNASRLSNILLTLEADIMLRVLDALVLKNFITKKDDAYCAGLAYDGIFVEKFDGLDITAMEAVANDTITQMGYRHLEMRCKTMENEHNEYVEALDERVYIVGLDDFREKKILLRSPTGSGKTYESIRYATAKFSTVLVIVHRQRLATSISRDYPQFDSYLNTEYTSGTLDADFQIICVNSLDRLKDPGKYECVICDEISSVMTQSIDMKMSPMCVKLFHRYIIDPNIKFIGMDALLCDIDISFWLNEFRRYQQSGITHKVVSPKAAMIPTKFCAIYDGIAELKSQMVKDIQNGKRVCIAYSTAIDKMDGLLSSTGVPYLNVNRNTKNDMDIASWVNYDVVAFSPTMDAGVDISFYVDGVRHQHFDVVYGIFHAANTTPKKAVQMLGRVRDCSDYRVHVKGHNTKTIFHSEQEFKEHLQKRYEYITDYNLEAEIGEDFNPIVTQDFRYRLTYNSMRHRKENLHYMGCLRYFLILNQWGLCSPKRYEENIDHAELQGYELLGQLEERKEIASSRVICDEEGISLIGAANLPQAQRREFVAWSVNKAFGLDKCRPPEPQDASYHERQEWIDECQSIQKQVLYPYDEDGNATGFDFIKQFAAHRDQYFRCKQLMELERGDNLPFTFLLSKKSFREITHHCHHLLKLIGFEKLGDTIAYVNWAAARRDYYSPVTCPKTGPIAYISKHTGLKVVNRDGGFRLCTRLVSPEIRSDGSFYLPGSPFVFINDRLEGMFPFGSGYRCSTCGKVLKKRSARKHTCVELPPNFEHRCVDGNYVYWCTICHVAVDTHLSRHIERHHDVAE